MKPFVISALCALLTGSSAASAQKVPRVDLGWGVDTITSAWADAAWHASVPAVFAAWRDYLLNDAHLQTPTEHWSSAEQERWLAYDLTAGVAYKGMPATVVDIRPADQSNDVFVVKTLFASYSPGGGAIRPVALTRVYAIREQDQWVFANALPRLTREWVREVVGPVTFVVDPAIPFDRRRAEHTVSFADSLAHLLAVPSPAALTYVVARSPEALHRVMGIDWTFGGQGHGYAISWNQMVLSGDPVFAEGNRHEIVHYVMAPLLESARPHPLINEGIATWLGGSVGRTYAELVHEYARYLHDHPEVTLDQLLERSGPDQGWYPAGAVIVDMVHEKGGWPAVNELLRSGRSDAELRTALSRLFDATWQEVGAAWSARVRQQ